MIYVFLFINIISQFQDGLVYEPISKQCGLPFKIDCIGSGRTKLQVSIVFCSEAGLN